MCRKGLFLLCLCLLTVSCSMSDDAEDDTVERVHVGDHVPLFSVEIEADGVHKRFSTTQLTGETVIVLFNTSCSDCQRELPRLNEYYLQHRADEGFEMVAISREEGEESVAAFWKEYNLSIPYFPQTDRRIYNLFATSLIPRVYYVSPEGIITHVFIETWQ